MSSELIGWFAALVGTIGFGSFAVPIKGDAANYVNIDPLVMQSYKTVMCFLTSWLVVLLGQEVTFTSWGVVSGLFWVPAVKNQTAAFAAVVVIMTGLFGMSYFSSTESLSSGSASSHCEEKEDQQLMNKDFSFQNDATPDLGPLEITQQISSPRNKTILIHGRKYSRRNLGRLSALMCGVWGGSILVPMHYATGNTSGLGYVISFSTGALVVNILLWMIRFVCNLCTLKSGKDAYNSLPSFHFRVMWLPGATAGTVWSLGNVGSIVAVAHLGQGVGYSASQAALFVR